MTDSKVALALVESSELRPTKANVEMIKEVVRSKCFVPLNSVLSLRESSRDVAIPGKVEYQLRDGSWVALDVDTNLVINSLIKEQDAFGLVFEMTADQYTFLSKVRALIKEHHGN